MSNVSFEVFTALRMIVLFLWVMMTCRLIHNIPEKHTLSIFRAEVSGPKDGDHIILQNIGMYLLLICPPELWQSYQQNYLIESWRTWQKD
jgi:hypothetical protein